MPQDVSYMELKKQFKRNNGKNYCFSLIGKVLAVVMSISVSLVFTFAIEAMEDQSMDKFRTSMVFLGLYLAANLTCGLFRRKYQNEYLRKGLTQFKNYVFEKILRQPISCYTSGDTAKFISAFSNDLASIESHYLVGELSLFVELLSYGVTAVVLIAMHPTLGTVILVSSLIAIAISFCFGGKVVRSEAASMEKASDFVSQTKDFLTGFTVIKSFKAEREILEVFKEKNVALESARQRRRESSDTVSIACNVTSIAVSIVFLAFGFLLAFNGQISVGKIIGFYDLSGNMLSPIRTLGSLLTNRRAADGLIHRIAGQIEEIQEDSLSGSKPLALPTQITLQNLSFAYGDGPAALNALNFTFEMGKRYAIVGASGCGKSTLLRLLMGYSQQYSGQIRFGDTELRDIPPEQLWEHISTIQQDVFCFNSTIQNNITMFRDFPEEAVHHAILASGLSAVYAGKGAEYLCGEGGCYLSGGERQRISIARCLIRQSPILLVDEAEAALDNETARDVLHTILRLENTLRLVITHRLDPSTMRIFDHILVLHNGKIEEQGTFDDLIGQKGYFYSLFRTAQ